MTNFEIMKKIINGDERFYGKKEEALAALNWFGIDAGAKTKEEVCRVAVSKLSDFDSMIKYRCEGASYWFTGDREDIFEKAHILFRTGAVSNYIRQEIMPKHPEYTEAPKVKK